MNFNKMYESIQSMIALEIFLTLDGMDTINAKFSSEIMHLDNMSNSIFSKLTIDEQFQILRIFDVYFRSGIPRITDSVYDGFNNIYNKSSGNTDPIMFEPSISAWTKTKHQIPMGSLSKCSTIEEIEKWNNKPSIKASPKLISEKLDGISLELIYEKGKLTKAITRGDGLEGDDITSNALYFDGVVKELMESMDCAVRGEVVITKENLSNINEILTSNAKDPLKNTRNGVAGLATKFKDRNEEILEMITFIAYEIQIFAMHDTGENVA